MYRIQKTTRLLRRGTASTLLLFAAAAAVAGPSPLPALQSVTIDVDISRLSASEQAALVPILRAARQMDALYMRQVWPGTSALLHARRSAVTSAAKAEIDALNFFKGPWGPTGASFIDGAPSGQPIGDYYPSGTTKHDMELWLGTLSDPKRRRGA